MTVIFTAAAIVAGIGLIAGIGLAVAARMMHVPTDERAERLAEVLPGANCGACGYSGCEGYANAISSEDAPCNLCIPGGADVANALSSLMGVEPQRVAEKRAMVLCAGTREHCKLRYEYHGEPTCAAASLLYSGQKQCNYGCLGFGDCTRACPFGAIALRDGIAVVDTGKCVGCGVCVAACPKQVIILAETKGRAVNRCSSRAPGSISRKHCSVSCLGCRLCAKNCPEQAITVENNLASVDMDQCTGCGLCISRCPTGSMILR
ncbi:MAG: RnfABCDGE type electron transport complex subunit B [Oscillospiraceae bacterium]|jgi:Na+-translocating ferredoxin:NAD+ oxidoreductase RNF subunit RnfB|nr:RnfABCDGE type electron transport complex subunit B [Oscillospiraceae bacterium]